MALAEKFPEAQEKEILKVIGNLVYYKFINPAVIAPDKYTAYKLLSLCSSGSGPFFMTGGQDSDQCCGSGIRCFFDPWIRDPGCEKSQVPDPGCNPDHISESLT